jgi:hypothetical protein
MIKNIFSLYIFFRDSILCCFNFDNLDEGFLGCFQLSTLVISIEGSIYQEKKNYNLG